MDSALLAVGMLGATVMPHAVYLHSALIRTGTAGRTRTGPCGVLRAIRTDVGLAMAVAGTVNISMLLLAPARSSAEGRGSDRGARAVADQLGQVIGTLFALALLASGLASTSVGGYAGAVIMDGLLHRRIPIMWRRLLTAIPLALLIWGLEPTRLLISSQVILSFGIPFALVPLVRIAADRAADASGAHPPGHAGRGLAGDRRGEHPEPDLDLADDQRYLARARIRFAVRVEPSLVRNDVDPVAGLEITDGKVDSWPLRILVSSLIT